MSVSIKQTIKFVKMHEEENGVHENIMSTAINYESIKTCETKMHSDDSLVIKIHVTLLD
jgi:hypothetical protein